MHVSPKGRKLLTAREGCRLKAYKDSVGVWTVGVGHTGRMAPPHVKPGMTISTHQADTFLAADLAPVERAIGQMVDVEMTQNQFDALASLIFNIGVGGFQGSTVRKRLNAKNYAGAADAFLLWEKPAALKKRREGERQQFLTPDDGGVDA